MVVRMLKRSLCLALVSCLLSIGFLVSLDPAVGQDSAPSSHLVFDDDFPGDILIHDVRVPTGGEALYTYYEALGWRGAGGGYAGIQAHPKSHLFLFSIWDHPNHSAPIRAVFHGPGTETIGFGGEGTGLKSWNFQLGWATDVWQTLVARCWPVNDHTHFGFWARDTGTGQWTHLVSMDVAAKTSFEGRTDAFIEDWLSTGPNMRTIHLRGGWKRRMDGNWFPFGSAKYSVNAWDLEPGKRSYNFRNNWNGGVDQDETGSFYFMTSGGSETVPQTTNPAQFAIPRSETEPDFATLRVQQTRAVLALDGSAVTVSWEIDEKSTPQFGYQLSLFNNVHGNGEPIFRSLASEPHARSATIAIESIPASGEQTQASEFSVQLQWIDLLDRRGEKVVVPVVRAD
jgi:hypothetical protein